MFEFVKRNLNEFKTFAVKGNVVDMAVGIIIGAAFGNVVNSVVKDIFMPVFGWLLGKVDFTNMYLTFPNADGEIIAYPSLEAAKTAGAVTINYGVFINTLISFVIVSFAVFLLIKAINKLKALTEKECEKIEEVTTKSCPRCYSTININATKCPCCTADI